VEDVFDAVQERRIMPIVRKKIAAEYLNVPGERVGRHEPGCREPPEGAADALISGVVVIGPNQTNHFSVIRGLEEIG
jgi:hypothetical protein